MVTVFGFCLFERGDCSRSPHAVLPSWMARAIARPSSPLTPCFLHPDWRGRSGIVRRDE